MNYNPAEASSLIPDGEYDAEIAAAEETTSKGGNEMIKLTVRVWAGGGGPRVVFDYVVNPSTLWRLKQIAVAIGKQELFQAGAMGAPDCQGESVRVAVKTQVDKKGAFPDRNVIARYLPPAAGVSHDNTPPVGADEEIPF